MKRPIRSHVRALVDAPRFEALDDRLCMAIAVWDGGPTGNGTSWGTAANWAGDVLPGPSDDVQLGVTGSSPVITLNSSASVNSITSTRSLTLSGALQIGAEATFAAGTTFAFTAGTLTGAGNLFLNGSSSWTGGTMSGTGQTVIGATGSLTLGALTNPRTLSRTLAVEGAAEWAGGDWRFEGGIVQNEGAFTVSAGGDQINVGGTNTFFNNGTFTKTGPGEQVIDAALFVNSGTLDVDAGTLAFAGFEHVMGGGGNVDGVLRAGGNQMTISGTWTGSGTLDIAGGYFMVVTEATIDIANVTFLNGNMSIFGLLTFNGDVTWGEGIMSGGSKGVVIGPEGSLTLVPTEGTRRLSSTLTINGTATWLGGQLRCGDAHIVNNGTFTITGPGYNDIEMGGLNSFHNFGSFIRGGAGSTTIDAVSFFNHGTVTVTEGTLAFDTRTHTLGGTGTVDGVLRFNTGTVNLSGTWGGIGTLQLSGATMNVDSALIVNTANAVISSGTLNGAGTATFNGTLSWTGGTMATPGFGVTVIGPAGSLSMGNLTAQRTLQRKLEIDGTAHWTAGDLRLNNGVIQNDGTFTVSGTINDILVSGSTPFNNNGTFHKNGPSSVTLDVATFNNVGTVSVNAGTLVFTARSHVLGGTGDIASGAIMRIAGGSPTLGGSWVGAGTLEITGGVVSVPASVGVAGAFAFTSGTLTGGGIATLNGASTWSGGAMSGSGRTIIGAGGVLTLDAVTAVRTLGRALEIDGSGVWSAGDWSFNAGSVQNDGTFTISSPVGISNLGGTNGWINSGLLTKTGPATIPLTSLNLANTPAGTIDVQQGTLGLSPASGSVANEGAVHLGAGALLQVTGDYVQGATGSLAVDVGGGLPSEYGRVVATGVATLAGSLSATLVNGFTPSLFATFDVVTGSSVSGQFSSVSPPAPPDATRKWVTLTGADRVQLMYTSIADWNNDGVVNSADVGDFINSWFEDQAFGTLLTDFDGNGISNSTDVSSFINQWFVDAT